MWVYSGMKVVAWNSFFCMHTKPSSGPWLQKWGTEFNQKKSTITLFLFEQTHDFFLTDATTLCEFWSPQKLSYINLYPVHFSSNSQSPLSAGPSSHHLSIYLWSSSTVFFKLVLSTDPSQGISGEIEAALLILQFFALSNVATDF
jgi:hypothetical protein